MMAKPSGWANRRALCYTVTRNTAEDRDAEWLMAANEKWKAMCSESGARYFEIDGDYTAVRDTTEGWIALEAERIRAEQAEKING